MDDTFDSDTTVDATTYPSKAVPSALYDDDDAKSTDASGPEYDDAKSTDTSGPELTNDSSSDDSDTDVMPNSDMSSAESDSERSSAKMLQSNRVICRKLSQGRRVRRSKHRTARSKGDSTPIGAVVNALDAWMTSKKDVDSCQPQWIPSSPDAEAQSQKLDGLQDAMSKLAPHEVALMKALLDLKLSS